MEKKSLLRCAATLFLLTAVLLFGYSFLHAENNPVQERMISIDKKDQNFAQALEAIAEQARITFNIHGELPQATRDLSLDQIPLDQALFQVLNIFGVSNHAAAYNPDTGTVMLAILKTSTQVAALSPQTQPRINIWNDKPLTEDQLSRFREQSEIIVAQMEEASLPLTFDQVERLREQSAEKDAEMEQYSQSLTPEQLERLRSQSRLLEMEMEEVSTPLTEEQLQRLRKQSELIEEEMEEYSQPLSQEQIQRLKENDPELIRN